MSNPPDGAWWKVISAKRPIFAIEMKKTLIVIAFWVAAVVLIALLVMSMGFTFPEALFISVQFLPGVLAARFLLSKISFKPRKTGIRDAVFVMLAILIAEIALVVMANIFIVHMRHLMWWQYDGYPETLFNPVFIGMILILLIIGDAALSRYLDKRYPAAQESIRFISDRRTVSLPKNEILYIESNDKEVTVYATEGRRFRNKTAIGQWEDLLGAGFLRIHRSYLVNIHFTSLATADTVSVAGTDLPISRKYKEDVRVEFRCTSVVKK